MRIKPNIRSSIGMITPRVFNKIAKTCNKREKELEPTSREYRPTVFFACIIDATEVVAGRQWKYTWTRSQITVSTTAEFVMTDEYSLNYNNGNFYAWNGCEMAHLANGDYNGPGFLNANIPVGYSLQPICVGTHVIMMSERSTDGNLIFVFSIPNAIDGTCA